MPLHHCQLKKITPINAFNRAKFGKNSTSYKSLNSLVKKIRGTQLKAKKTTDQETYSVSQQSYGSIILNFQNLVTDLESLGAKYNPPNESIIIDKLKALGIQGTEKNNNVLLPPIVY